MTANIVRRSTVSPGVAQLWPMLSLRRFFEELCSIIKKTVGLREPVRAALEPLVGKISLALIYGAIAKQSDTEDSDIDLLLVSDNLTLEETYSALMPVEKLLDRSVKLDILAWNDGPGRVVFEARVGDKVVVSNAYFEYD